jgi:sulfur relay (sulfurtransferase) complex TusBCD TusD component (DsrE family)
MAQYLLIETRDPFASKGFAQHCELASALANDGAEVTLFLVENGVLAARGLARVHELEKLVRLGVLVLADEFALRERGITASELTDQVKGVSLDALVERLGTGAKAIWN